MAVRDLAAARADLQDLGFRIKDGRVHAGGIVNAHVKTRAGSLELLTVDSAGGERELDSLARDYAEFLSDGEGGAFLALGSTSVDTVALRLEAAGLSFRVERGGAWDYLLPDHPNLRHVYVIQMHAPPEDPDSLLAHMNGATGVSAVALDGGAEVERLLEAVGAVSCEVAGQGTDYALGSSRVSLVPPTAGVRPRVRAMAFDVFTLGRPPADVRGLTVGWSSPAPE